MIRIGLVGEDPNDTYSIANLLLKKYSGKIQFFILAKGIRGFHLDNPKIKKTLPIEFKSRNCSFVIYIRDLDGFKQEQVKINSRTKWFKELDATLNNNGLLLLNIWELEGLILADIATFNKLYNVSYKYSGDPMVKKEPKEELMRITRKNRKQYRESHCPDIFKELDFAQVEKKCAYFKDFIAELNKKLSS